MDGPLFPNIRSSTLPPIYKLQGDNNSVDTGTNAYLILVDAANARVSPVQMIIPKDGQEQRILSALRQNGANSSRS